MACIRCYVSLLHVLLSVCVVITSSTITATPTPTQPTSRVSRDVTTAGVRGSADYDDASTHYFIIIDAGSSGSRIHVFPYHYANLEGQKWKQRLFRATTAGGEDYVNHSNKNGDLHHHFPVVQESHSKKIVPGNVCVCCCVCVVCVCVCVCVSGCVRMCVQYVPFSLLSAVSISRARFMRLSLKHIPTDTTCIFPSTSFTHTRNRLSRVAERSEER